MNNNGEVVAVMHDYNGLDGDGGGVFVQKFNADGNKIGNEFLVNNETAGNQQFPHIAMGNDTTVFLWQSPLIGGGESDIFARTFDVAGNPQDDQFLVNCTIEGEQQIPSIGGISYNL
jgi:hypothetical protein